MKTYTKGEWIKIIDFGIAEPGISFTLNTPYRLTKDLTPINGFQVEEDNEGIINGWNNYDSMDIKFSKATPEEVKKHLASKAETKLTIQDLAMFYGGEFIHEPAGMDLTFTIDSERLKIMEDQQDISEVKPILRPLSDMTDEETKNAVDPMRYGLEIMGGRLQLMQAAEMTKYLISKQFDVFGWIEKGLAIDKTKL